MASGRSGWRSATGVRSLSTSSAGGEYRHVSTAQPDVRAVRATRDPPPDDHLRRLREPHDRQPGRRRSSCSSLLKTIVDLRLPPSGARGLADRRRCRSVTRRSRDVSAPGRSQPAAASSAADGARLGSSRARSAKRAAATAGGPAQLARPARTARADGRRRAGGPCRCRLRSATPSATAR